MTDNEILSFVFATAFGFLSIYMMTLAREEDGVGRAFFYALAVLSWFLSFALASFGTVLVMDGWAR